MSLLPDAVRREAFAEASRFRGEFYECLTARRDELFELVDAVLCADGAVKSPVDLTLLPEHRRGHGAMYGGLNRGRIDVDRLRTLLAGSAKVVERGGNIAVQVFHAGIPGDVIESLKKNATEIGGRVDGELESLVVLTFPVRVGFPAIESLLAALPEDAVEWEYGNVFDEQGEPLAWWEDTT
ncbi:MULTISPECIES: transposase [unclassified Streptomyces]|uniref:transposase n=1 Tax=unclassified Streptomyces TaxID=2593676 RepID=UPI0031F9B673